MKCSAFILTCLIFVGLLASYASASAIADAIPTAGLVSYWPADGDTNDIVGPNNGSFVAPSGFDPGYVGQAFAMNGGYINIPDSPSLSLTGPFTLTAMIKINRNDIQQAIIEKYDQPGTNGYILRISGGKIAAYICDPTLFGANHGIIGSTTVSVGVWHSVAAVYDGSTLKVYLDGVLDGTVATTVIPTDGPSSLKIGARGDDANVRLGGLMDGVRIYNRALSASEIPPGDGPPSNVHNIADGDVASLNAAIIASNANPDPDVINLAPGGHYILTSAAGPDGFHGDSGLPIIQGISEQAHGLLTINGNGATIERSSAAGTPQFRILNALYTDLTLDGVVIRGGYGQGSRCGGGGLYLNVSNTIVKNSTITDNFGFEGGGICNNNASTLKVENS